MSSFRGLSWARKIKVRSLETRPPRQFGVVSPGDISSQFGTPQTQPWSLKFKIRNGMPSAMFAASSKFGPQLLKSLRRETSGRVEQKFAIEPIKHKTKVHGSPTTRVWFFSMTMLWPFCSPSTLLLTASDTSPMSNAKNSMPPIVNGTATSRFCHVVCRTNTRSAVLSVPPRSPRLAAEVSKENGRVDSIRHCVFFKPSNRQTVLAC